MSEEKQARDWRRFEAFLEEWDKIDLTPEQEEQLLECDTSHIAQKMNDEMDRLRGIEKRAVGYYKELPNFQDGLKSEMLMAMSEAQKSAISMILGYIPKSEDGSEE